jgi:hypothetical protein
MASDNTNAEYRAKYLRVLMERVREDRHPSTTHMDLIERALPPQWIPDYLDILLEKIEDDGHPSISMLKRIGMLLERVPQSVR